MEKKVITTSETKITVDGSIINELSEKIPSNIVALNELIKNAYDAQANNIDITIDLPNKKITIVDDGDGMSENSIDELFHISHSQKEYGTEVNGRIIQGSKGLGFLAVFRFGKTVTWNTNTGDNGFQFTVNLDEIVAQRDISNFPIVLNHDRNIKKGTKIEIFMEDSNVKLLQPDLNDQTKIKKIVNSFCDNKMTIKLTVNNENPLISSEINAAIERTGSQIMKISFDSTKDKHILFEYPFNKSTFELAKIQFDTLTIDFDLKIELFAYHLASSESAKFNPLFHKPDEDNAQITPLLYINNNLFNNYNLFDVNINRRKSSGESLPQLIGTIKIFSRSKDLIFNSDRTQFVQNELTNNITEILKKINILIQDEGSKRKKHLKDFNFILNNPLEYSDTDNINAIKNKLLENIKSDFYFKNTVKIRINPQKDFATYEIFGRKIKINLKKVVTKETQKPNNKLPKLELTTYQETLPLYGDVIDLRDYIGTAKDSNGQQINLDEIKIEYDNQENRLIGTVEEDRSIIITFSYFDTISQVSIVKKLSLVFRNFEAEVLGNNDLIEILIKFNGLENYEITFHPIISRLVYQINSLYSQGSYLEVIACSLRSLYELSIESIMEKTNILDSHNKTNEFNVKFRELKNDLNSDLKNNIGKIITFLNENNSILSVLCINSKFQYPNTSNILNTDQFISAVECAHLGAHKSTTHITKNFIDDLGVKTGTYLVLINELLK